MCTLLVLFLIDSTFESLLVLDQLSADIASTVIRATGHQVVRLCEAVCGEKKTHILAPLMKRWCHYFPVPGIVAY